MGDDVFQLQASYLPAPERKNKRTPAPEINNEKAHPPRITHSTRSGSTQKAGAGPAASAAYADNASTYATSKNHSANIALPARPGSCVKNKWNGSMGPARPSRLIRARAY